jgi:ubiquinone/menaquinone biosynthesis C-methylase UbiE
MKMSQTAENPDNATWFEDHYFSAAQQVVDFLAGDGLSLEGKRVADVGTGDGIIALGLFNLAKPALMVGYDLNPVDTDYLLSLAQSHGVGQWPEDLRFDVNGLDSIPAATGAFDFVISWSAFEHISEPLAMAREIRRLLAPGGVAMIQLFPFYFSEHGDHGWARPSFEHLVTGEDIPDVYLNRITFDGLYEVLVQADLRVAKVELIHQSFHLPTDLKGVPLSDLAIGGVKMLAVPS